MTTETYEGPDEAQLREFLDAPVPRTSRLIDFDDASVVMLKTNPPQFILRVKGVKRGRT